MAERITTTIEQYTSCGFELTLQDTNGDDVNDAAISSISWSLVDEDGEVINSRLDVSETVANPVIIELEPDDTAVSVSSAVKKFNIYLQVTWTYTDANLGVGSEESKEYEIPVYRKYNAKSA